MRPYSRYLLRVWAIRNWWWIACFVGEGMFLNVWVPVQVIKPDQGWKLLIPAAMMGAAWTGIYMRLRPPYVKGPTFRQAWFQPRVE